MKGRAPCLVIRGNKIPVVKHRVSGIEYFCTPGGGIEEGETPEQAAIRELSEERCVAGEIIKKTSEHADPFDVNRHFYAYQIDIGEQTPKLGYDPELVDNPILIGVQWVRLNEICERDRTYGLQVYWVSVSLLMNCHLGEMIYAIQTRGIYKYPDIKTPAEDFTLRQILIFKIV